MNNSAIARRHWPILAVIIWSAGASAQVLQVHNTSLTADMPSATHVQGLRLVNGFRAVNLDGTLREGSAIDLAIQANPFPEEWNDKNRHGKVRLDTGSYDASFIALELPAPAFTWPIAHSYNHRQSSGSTHLNSLGPLGYNWSYDAQMELVYRDDPNSSSASTDDMVYLVLSATSFLQFRRKGTTGDDATVFIGVNGAAGGIKVQTAPGAPDPDVWDLWVYYDQTGLEVSFFGIGDSDIPTAKQGQLWRLARRGTNDQVTTDDYIAYVGALDKSDALSTGYDSAGRILLAFDTAGRKYEHTYASGRLTQIDVKVFSGGSWIATGDKVQYTYYGTSESFGSEHDLKTVTVTRGTSDPTQFTKLVRYFRYYTQSWSDQEDRRGEPHLLMLAMGPEGTRAFDIQDGTFDDDHLASTTATASLKPFSLTYLEYAENRDQVATGLFNGECSCTGGPGNNGTIQYSYETSPNYTTNATSAYDTFWATRTVVEEPDGGQSGEPINPGAFITQYFDETGQPLSRVMSTKAPHQTPVAGTHPYWPKLVERDSSGRVIKIHWPRNISGYAHNNESSQPLGTFTTDEDEGLVRTYNRVVSGNMTGFLASVTYQVGTPSSPTVHFESRFDYESASYTPSTGLTIVRPLLAVEYVYRVDQTNTNPANHPVTDVDKTDFEFTFWTSQAALSLKRVETLYPIVSTAKNGSGQQASSNEYYRTDGTLAFKQEADGIFTYTAYSGGLLSKIVEDAKTNHSTEYGSADDPTNAFGITESSAGTHVVSSYTYVSNGILDTTTRYVGSADELVERSYHTVLDDRRKVELYIPRMTSPPSQDPVFHGPVRYRVSNLAGFTAFDGTVAVTGTGGTTSIALQDWILHTTPTLTVDPLAALDGDVGTVERLKTYRYSSSGMRLDEERTYHDIPASGAGSEKTNYDAVHHGYDANGRRVRAQATAGTIVKRYLNARGLLLKAEMGTDDELDSPNMRWILGNGYDRLGGGAQWSSGGGGAGGAGGNGDGSASVAFCPKTIVEDTVLGASTEMLRDDRGFVTASVRNSPVSGQKLSPNVLYKRDASGRIIAAGLYKTGESLLLTDDPLVKEAGRLALIEISYDERGNIFKVVRRKINLSDGAIVSNGELTSLTWFDDAGRIIKYSGRELYKIQYDALGRERVRYLIASAGDTSYAELYDRAARVINVEDDVVLEQYQTGYNRQTGDPLVTVVIKRHHNDRGSGETLGTLDLGIDNDDLAVTASDLQGYASITAQWFDFLHRPTTTAFYGTNGSANFNRATTSEPTASSSGLLVTRRVYDTAGALQKHFDARAIETRYEYDAAGRQRKVIENHTDGSPGGGTNNDQDRVTRHEYGYPQAGPGLIRQVIADRDGTADDQVTTYYYGTTIGSGLLGSAIATGHLLQRIEYPDVSGASDDVELAYSLPRLVSAMQDQSGNVITLNYDYANREISRVVSTLDSDFNGAIRAIATGYTDVGQIDLATQYSDAGMSAVVDQVRLTYDGLGNLTKMEEDWDSAIGAAGIAAKEVSYTYERHASGRSDRRKSMVWPGGDDLLYKYLSTGDRHDDDASRVSRLSLYNSGTQAEIPIVDYEYLGAEQVVGTDAVEPDAYQHLFGSTSGTYPFWDQFGRTTDDRWTRTTGNGSRPTVDFYEAAVSYDETSNPTVVDDKVHATKFDVKYDLDNLNRLQRAQEGDWGGASFNSTSRDEQWDLGPTGNSVIHKLDLDGNGTFIGTGELNENNPDTSTASPLRFNLANEQRSRDTDNDGSANYTLDYDEVGGLIDDGKDYTYVYDPFGRLRFVKTRGGSPVVVAEYRYNAFGYRIAEHTDLTGSGTGMSGDPDGSVDDDDPWYFHVFDERWRVVATFRVVGSSGSFTADGSAKARYVFHGAGFQGIGSASYIDDLVLRNRENTLVDSDVPWIEQSDGTLEERIYYFQNWRHDVVGILTAAGGQIEQARYSGYGMPYNLAAGDLNSDGAVNVNDAVQYQQWAAGSVYDRRADLDLNGQVNVNDAVAIQALMAIGLSGGRGVLSRWDIENSSGLAGYQWSKPSRLYSVRNRAYSPELARFLARDSAGLLDGSENLYEYVGSMPLAFVDPVGLFGLLAVQPADKPDYSKPIGPFKGFEDPKYQEHDKLIRQLVDKFNKDKAAMCKCTPGQAAGIPDLTPELVKAWLITESGGSDARSREAWPIDPGQVNVPQDWNDYKKDFGLKKPEKRNEGTTEQNLEAAICYLCAKGFGKSGQPPRNRPDGFFDGWKKALERYNGVSTEAENGKQACENYAESIEKRAKNPGEHVPIQYPKGKK